MPSAPKFARLYLSMSGTSRSELRKRRSRHTRPTEAQKTEVHRTVVQRVRQAYKERDHTTTELSTDTTLIQMRTAFPHLISPSISLCLLLRLHILPILPLRVMDPVHQTRWTEAHAKLLMMQVMPSRETGEKVITGVHCGRLE